MLDLLIAGAFAIHLAGGAAEGAGRDGAMVRGIENPIRYLGTTFDATGCAKEPLEIGTGFTVTCSTWSAITSVDGRALVVTLYGPSQEVSQYLGRLPQKLAWGDTITEVWEDLGEPDRITDAYGTPTLIYRFDGMPYGSLELRFSGGDRLASINACLTH